MGYNPNFSEIPAGGLPLFTDPKGGGYAYGANALWTSINGRPSINVSPVGIAAGYPKNNGADFGPDTPGTQTNGIQEAVNAANGIYPVVLLPGVFTINTPIVWQPTAAGGVLPGFALVGCTPFITNGIIVSPGFSMGVTITPSASFPSSSYMISINGSKTANHIAFVNIQGINFVNGSNSTVSGVYHYLANQACYMNLHFQSLYNSLSQDGGSNASVVINVIVDQPGNIAFYDNCSNTYYSECVIFGDTGAGGFLYLDSLCSYPVFASCSFQGASTTTPYLVSLHGASNEPFFVGCDAYNGLFTTTVTVGVGAAPTVHFVGCFLGNFTALLDIQNIANAGLVTHCVGTRAVGASGATLYSSEVISNNFGATLTWEGGAISSVTVNYPSGMPGNCIASTYFTNVIGVNKQGFTISTPSVPASTGSQTNLFPFTARIYLQAGSSTVTYLLTDATSHAAGVSVIVASGYGAEIAIDPGETIKLTYSNAPTWSWYGT